jgi:hypothetical protein
MSIENERYEYDDTLKSGNEKNRWKEICDKECEI